MMAEFPGLPWYLALAAALFCLGLFAVLARRNAVAVLMGLALMLGAVILNLAAFWRYGGAAAADGQIFALAACIVAAAQMAVGVALAIRLWRSSTTAVLDELDELKG